MALSFLKDRDENAALGNLGAFALGGAEGKTVQAALEIYRKDQKTHHEQSIASDLTRGLLRKVFRETVLESSKQVKRKYSYSAVGSTVQEEIEDANMGIMSKLKKLQKERLIVARLGFPDKAMEIDEHIEKIRADLREERDKEDSRVMNEAMAALAVLHHKKVSNLEKELKDDEKSKRDAFQQERAVTLRKQEKQFAQLVDDAIKRAIGKSKAWEEKAAELDADHLDRWREEVAASLTASAWGGSSSALDQLASQHQREIKRMETAQANEWTLMLMRHHTLRRNCQNVIMVEQKKLRNTCKKNAEERHRREMLGVQEELERKTPPSSPQTRSVGTGLKDVAGMLRDAMEEGATGGGESQGAKDRSPVRPSSAPPSRGRRPQPSQHAAAAPVAVESAGDGCGAADDGDHKDEDCDSCSGDSRDLRGFDELERVFSYSEYPVAGSPEEPVWVHVPWCGANSGDIAVLGDEPQAAACLALSSSSLADATLPIVKAGYARDSKGGGADRNAAETPNLVKGEGDDGGGAVDTGEPATRRRSSADSARLAAAAAIEKFSKASAVAETIGDGDNKNRLLPRRPLTEVAEGGGVRESQDRDISAFQRTAAVAGHGGLKRYDWDATMVPKRPALLATSRIPSGTRAEKIKARNEKRRHPNKKVISWGENLEVPPEPKEDNSEEGDATEGGGSNDVIDRRSGFDSIVDNYVDDGSLDDEQDEPSVGSGQVTTHPSEGGVKENTDCGDLSRPVLDGWEARVTTVALSSSPAAAGTTAVAASPRKRREGVEQRQSSLTASKEELTSNRDRGELAPANIVPSGSASPRRVSEDSEEGSKLNSQARPLQHVLDQFCLIRVLHGDLLSLLGQILGHEACRNSLRKWSLLSPWEGDLEACLQATRVWDTHGSVSWGLARAAAVAVASPSVLAPFIASASGQRMVRSKSGREAMGGRTVPEEPAIARSRRPWRTLFERAFGSLPHGAILSLAQRGDGRSRSSEHRTTAGGAMDDDHVSSTAAAAGKVVWANEGFERLAGVDAIDVVGHQLDSLFEVGVDEGEELMKSIELSKSCMVWMTMAGQGQEPTEVLCLHQPVTVPPQLSDEGCYSALLLFDTASVVLEDMAGQELVDGEGFGGGGLVLNRADGAGDGPHDDQDQDRHRRQQCCIDLSRAMAILLADNDNDEEDNNGGGGSSNDETLRNVHLFSEQQSLKDTWDAPCSRPSSSPLPPGCASEHLKDATRLPLNDKENHGGGFGENARAHFFTGSDVAVRDDRTLTGPRPTRCIRPPDNESVRHGSGRDSVDKISGTVSVGGSPCGDGIGGRGDCGDNGAGGGGGYNCPADVRAQSAVPPRKLVVTATLPQPWRQPESGSVIGVGGQQPEGVSVTDVGGQASFQTSGGGASSPIVSTDLSPAATDGATTAASVQKERPTGVSSIISLQEAAAGAREGDDTGTSTAQGEENYLLSGEETISIISSTEPRDDLLLSPREEQATRVVAVLREGGPTPKNGGARRENDVDDDANIVDTTSFALSPESRSTTDANDNMKADRDGGSFVLLADEGGSLLDDRRGGSGGDDDQYEDDFFSDEEEEQESPASPNDDGRISINSSSNKHEVTTSKGDGDGGGAATVAAGAGKNIAADTTRQQKEEEEDGVLEAEQEKKLALKLDRAKSLGRDRCLVADETNNTKLKCSLPSSSPRLRREDEGTIVVTSDDDRNPTAASAGTTINTINSVVGDGRDKTAGRQNYSGGIFNSEDDGQESRGYASSDGVCSSTTAGGGVSGVFDGVEEDEESWASGDWHWDVPFSQQPPPRSKASPSSLDVATTSSHDDRFSPLTYGEGYDRDGGGYRQRLLL